MVLYTIVLSSSSPLSSRCTQVSKHRFLEQQWLKSKAVSSLYTALLACKSAALMLTFKKKVTSQKLQWIRCSAGRHASCFKAPVAMEQSLSSSSLSSPLSCSPCCLQQPNSMYPTPLHQTSSIPPASQLDQRATSLHLLPQLTPLGYLPPDVNAASYCWPTQLPVQKQLLSPSIRPHRYSHHTPRPFFNLFAYISISISLLLIKQCKASLHHRNLISQPLNVSHHLFCQLVIFYSKAGLSHTISWISIQVISFSLPPRLRVSHEKRSSVCSGPGFQHL